MSLSSTKICIIELLKAFKRISSGWFSRWRCWRIRIIGVRVIRYIFSCRFRFYQVDICVFDRLRAGGCYIFFILFVLLLLSVIVYFFVIFGRSVLLLLLFYSCYLLQITIMLLFITYKRLITTVDTLVYLSQITTFVLDTRILKNDCLITLCGYSEVVTLGLFWSSPPSVTLPFVYFVNKILYTHNSALTHCKFAMPGNWSKHINILRITISD